MTKPATETLSLAPKRTSKKSAKEGKGGDSPSQLIDEKALKALIRTAVALNTSTAAQRPGTKG